MVYDGHETSLLANNINIKLQFDSFVYVGTNVLWLAVGTYLSLRFG